MSMVAPINAIDGVTRRERRTRRKQADLGPSIDPIRQQGRDPQHVYERERWYSTPQSRDRSAMAGRRRLYHDSYQTSSGTTWDEFFEDMAERAAVFEDAGINLGWGACASAGASGVRGSVDAETERRYLTPRPNSYRLGLIKKRR